MANYRQIHTQIWRDNWFLELRPDEKLLFIYLFSNDNSNLAGIYEIHESIIALETGLRPARIREILVKLEAFDKVHYGNGVVWIVNMRKYHSNASEKIQKNIDAAIYDIQDGEIKKRYCIANGIELENTVSIPYVYPMDTLSHNKSNSNSKNKIKSESKIKSNNEPILPTDRLYENPCVRFYVTEIGDISIADATEVEQLSKVFHEKDIEDAVLQMKAQELEHPNAGYLKTILANWFRDRKIKKVYS